MSSNNVRTTGNLDVYLVKTDSLGKSGCSETSNPLTIINLTPVVYRRPYKVYTTSVTKNPATVVGALTSTPQVVCCHVPLKLSGDTVMCPGNSVTLTGSGAFSYQWSTGSTASSIVVSPAGTTTYSLTGLNGPAGCTTLSITVTVLPTPIVNVTAPDTICTGSSISLTASGGATYSWSPATGLSNPNISNPVANPTSTTGYTVTVGPCPASSSTTVTVDQGPAASIAGATTVCAGASATLTASGGGTYSWSTGETASSIVVSPTANTTYSVTVANANGCTNTASALVSTTPNINPTVSPSAICAGDSALITASGGGTYSWNTGETTASIYASPTTTTTYTVTVVTGPCTSSAVATVSVTGTITAVISGQTSICAGESATLTVTGGSSFSWNTGATTASIVVTPTSSSAYSVNVTSSSCSASASVTVTVNSLPVATISSPSTICAGSSATLTASGGGTYAWNTGATASSIVVTPTNTTNYSVTVTNSAGCTDTASVLVTTTPNINPTVSPSAICAGDSALLTASGGGTYSWTTGETTASIYASPTTTTSYTVTVVTGACTVSAVATVTVTGTITAVINGPNSICAGTSATLTATGGSSFSWSTGATTASISITPTGNSTYTVTVVSASCSDDTTITVTVNSLPTPAISGPATICAGASGTLSATGGSSFVWSTGATSSSISVSPTSNATYTVTAANVSGCTASVSALLSVSSNPVVTVSGNTTLCTGDITTLTASGGSDYSWSTGSTTSAITVSPSAATTYTVVASNSAGCTNSLSVNVNVSSAPVAGISGNNTICAGDNTILTASGGGNYAWSTGATSAAITVSPPATANYSVVVSVGSCSDTANYTVTVLPGPVASAGTNMVINIGNSTTLMASGGGTYSWVASPDLSCTNCQNPVVSPAQTTTYCVYVTDAAGCVDSACVTVTVEINCEELFIPSAFSPNGDNVNDQLCVYNNCIETMSLVIFDRWGEKVFETTDRSQCWDGVFRGKKLNGGVFGYYLYATLLDGRTAEQKGNISLMK